MRLKVRHIWLSLVYCPRLEEIVDVTLMCQVCQYKLNFVTEGFESYVECSWVKSDE